ncbi:SHOCT domain-containing protein [Georgenia muralis]|uniref:Putative membrane protein n=1 Tax=Georgenia muralis TaxID=154117 RepID=A0A3N5A4D9_9MICO|nr:SHOCT domain-containing protein [Georgenia muralis]RPF28225.1 putative membrane protein [Georgenia muralis]
MMWNEYGMGTGLGGLVVVLLVGGVLLLVGGVLRRGRSGRTPDRVGQGGRGVAPGPSAPSTEQILAERYARGEIDAREYEERVRQLRGR